MPQFEINNELTGESLLIEANEPPSQEAMDSLFKQAQSPDSDYNKGRVSSAGSSFMRTGGELFGGAIQGIGRLNQMLTGVPLGGDPRAADAARIRATDEAIEQGLPIDRAQALVAQEQLAAAPITQFGSNLKVGAREAYPVNPQFAEEFWSGTIPSGAGSLVSGGGILPLTVALQGLSGGESAAQRAIDQGVPENANTAFGLTAPIVGVSEAVLGQGGRILSGLRNAATGTAMGTGRRILTGGAKEAAQEGIEQFGGNVVAQQVVDPNQSLTEGVTEGAAAGFILGGGVGGIQSLASRNKTLSGRTTEDLPDIPQNRFTAPQSEEDIADVDAALFGLDADGESVVTATEQVAEQVLKFEPAQEATPLLFEQDFPGGTLPETAQEPRYSLDDDQSPDAVMQRYPDVFSDPTFNQLPVEIQRPDGTVYAGVFNGYMDAVSPEKKFITVPSIGRKQGTSWSHGGLRSGEKILTPVPTEQQFREMRSKTQLPDFEAWGRENIPSTARQSVGEESQAITPESIQPSVDKFQQDNPNLPKITVVNDPNWRSPQGRGIRGESRAGSITINMAFVQNEEQAMRVMREEAAHQVLLTLDGRKALSDFALRELPADEISSLKEKYRRQSGENATDYELRIVDEWMSQNEQEARSFIGRIIDKIKEWLSNLGFRNLTNKEASRAVFRALRNNDLGKASLTALQPLIARQSMGEAPPGQRFTGPTFDRSQTSYSDSARGEYEYLRQAPKGEANKRQLEYARNLINFHGANYQAALNEINNIDSGAFQAVARAVLTAEIASQMGTPGSDSFNRLLPVLLRLEPQNQQQATDTGQALQSFKVVKDVLDPHAPILSFLGLLKQRHQQAVDTQAGSETPTDVNKGVADSTAAASDLTADGFTEADAAWKQVIREVQANNPFQSVNLRSRIEAMFPLAGWREKFTELGTKNLAKQFAELIGMEKPSKTGNIAEFDANIRRELGKKLKEAFAETGIKPPDATTKPSLESQISAFIGADPLKSDKLARVDERVREKIGDDPGLNMLWDFVAGGMSSNAPSFSTVRRIAADVMKALKVDRSKFLDDAYVASTKSGVVAEVSRRVREAALPEQVAGLDTAGLEQAVSDVFDNIAATQRNILEAREILRRARESLKLTAKPEQQAQAIIDQFAKTQTDTPTWTKPQENVIRAVFRNYLNWRETPAGFRAKLKEAGIGDGLTERLLSVANREQAIKRTAERVKAAEDFQKWLNDDGKVQSLLRKAAERTGINWRELFRDLPENQEQRRAMILERASQDSRVANLTTSAKTALAAALDRAWERQRIEYFRAAFSRLVPLPKVLKESVRDSIKETIPELFKLANQGLLDNEAIRNQIASKLGIEAFDGPTAKKLAELGQKAQRAPEGIIRNKFLDQAKTVVEDSQSIDPYELAKSFWYANVLSGTGTAATILSGSAGFGLLNTFGAALDAAIVMKRPDVAMRMIGDFASAIPEGARRFYDVVTTGDYSRFPEFNRILKDNLEGRFKANEFEKLLRSPDWRKKIAGAPGLVQRFLTGADQLFSLGVRDAGAYYASLSRGDMESLGALMAKNDKKLTDQARQQAIDEFKANGIPNPKPLNVRERQRELLEQGVTQDIKEGAEELGRVANLNQHPPGLGGKIYDFLVQIPFVARAAVGGTFLRAGINLAANASNWNPVTGPINYARSSPVLRVALERAGARPGVVEAFSPMLAPEQRRQVAFKATAGLAIAVGIASRFLFKDHDDEEWEIAGSFAGMTPAQIRNLRQQGVQPNSLWKVDPKTGKIRSVSYKEWPFAGSMAMIGAIRDAQLYKGQEFNEETAMRQIVNGSMAGFSYLTELPLLSQASRLFGADSYGRSQDPAQGLERVGQAVQRAASGITSGAVPFSSLAKDIDTFYDPANYKPENQDPGFGIVLRSIPFARRYAGKPELNIFGEPIQTERLPWSRVIRSQDNEPEMNLLASLMAKGVNPVWPGRSSLIVDSDGVRRQMTEDEWHGYAKAYGQEFKATLRDNLQEVRAMPAFIEEVKAARTAEYGDISNQPPRMQKKIADEIREYSNLNSAEGWLRAVHRAVTKQTKASMGFGPALEEQE